MTSRLRLPATLMLSLVAALTTWLTMTTWSGFSEAPGGYLRPLAVGCVLVALSGALLRSARLHVLLVVLGQLAIVGLWLNHQFAAGVSVLGWLPTPTSVRSSLDALAASMDAAQSYAAPVPDSVPTLPPVLIAAGTLLAVLVDLLACGLRRVPLAGLPLLAMYTAPVSMLEGGVDWWKFALVATAFLLLLAGEEATRLAHWGRDLGASTSSRQRLFPGSNRTVWPSARKIGLTATAMAVVVPIFLPTFTGGILSGAGGGIGDGEGGVRIDNPMLDMKRNLERGEDEPQLQITTDDPSPQYLRIAVLDEYDGTWRPSDRDIPVSQRVDGDLPPPAGLDGQVRTATYRHEIVADDSFKSSWLPAPYPSLDVSVAGDWRYDNSTMDIVSAAEDKTAAGVSYSLTALAVQPTADQLRASGPIPSDIFRRYTAVDESVPDQVRDWVEDLTERVTSAGTNRAERAKLLQDWFAEPHTDPDLGPSFEYSLARSDRGSGVDELTDFLQNSRTGYCEQFAGAMALMARTIEIPARVAVGFLKPQAVPEAGSRTWIYSTHDLHAWPELYFEGVGWVRFEPTPGARPGATAPAYSADLAPVIGPTAGPTTATPGASDSASAQPTASPRLPLEPVDGAEGSGGSNRPWLVTLLVAVPVLLALAALPRLARTVVRRRRWMAAQSPVEQAEAAWTELRDSMVDLRLPWNPKLTVRQAAAEIVPRFRRRPGPGEQHLARLITSNPEAQAALDRIVLLVERARYARTVPDVADVRRDVELCVESLRLGVDKTVRRKATWLPASLVNRSPRPKIADSGLAALSEPALTR